MSTTEALDIVLSAARAWANGNGNALQILEACAVVAQEKAYAASTERDGLKAEIEHYVEQGLIVKGEA